MKINDSFKNKAGLGVDKAGTEKAGTGKTAEKQQIDAKASESVTLSPMAAQLKSLQANGAADNVFDSEKVAAIKSAIAGGKFKVSSEKVADGLIESVKDLLNTKKT